MSFLAKNAYFTGRGARGRLSRAFFSGIGAIGVERGAGAAAQQALDLGLERLTAGDAFAIYPEGTRSLDGRLYRGRTGVAWLALTSGAPVVPVGLIGTDELQPVGSSVPRLRRFTVAFGEPLDLSHHGAASSGRARRHATDEIMAAIRDLSGQVEAGSYNDPPAASVVERVRRAIAPTGRTRPPRLTRASLPTRRPRGTVHTPRSRGGAGRAERRFGDRRGSLPPPDSRDDAGQRAREERTRR
nr:hypothetical protein GCM10025699_76780 [Microbacterium flavescens]